MTAVEVRDHARAGGCGMEFDGTTFMYICISFLEPGLACSISYLDQNFASTGVYLTTLR